MTGRDGVSRRGLLGGLFQRPLQEIRERLPASLTRASPDAAAGGGRMHPPRRLRPRTHTVPAFPDATAPQGPETRFVVDLTAKPLAPGHSWRVVAEVLAESLVLVRVNETHYAATTGECPIDASDLHWKAEEDRLWCPACDSRWRLDGAVTKGPSRRPLLPLLLEEKDGVVRIHVP